MYLINDVLLNFNKEIYEFYEWEYKDDADVKNVLCLLTFMSMEEVERLSSLEGQEINEAKKIAAYEITKLIHGEEEAKKAEQAARALFEGKGNVEDMPTTKLENINISIVEALVITGIAPSKGQARTLIAQGGITLNDEKIADINYQLSEKDFKENVAILRKGKKVYHKLSQ